MSETTTNNEPEPTLADHLATIEKIVGAFPHPVEQTPRERAVIDRLIALLDRPVSIAPPKPMQERSAGIAQMMENVHNFGVSAKAHSHEVIAERMFDAMCCGARAADLPFLATDRPMTLALIDLLFAKISDTREADAIEAAGEPEAPAKINLNTRVWVRLTDHGVEVARRADFLIYDAALQRGREPKAGEWIRNEIWALMHAFGPAAYSGHPVFVDNDFVLTDPAKPSDR